MEGDCGATRSKDRNAVCFGSMYIARTFTVLAQGLLPLSIAHVERIHSLRTLVKRVLYLVFHNSLYLVYRVLSR